MKTITDKITTLRRAIATSTVVGAEETIQRMKTNDLPKKDVLIVARVAGITAAKKTPDLIPYCHPLPVRSVEVDFEVEKDRVIITAAVTAIYATGVEMEALAAASVAALTIYDMLKPVDTNLEIISTKLLKKKGGKTDFKNKISKDFCAAIIVCSDGTAAGSRQDKSGKIIQERMEGYGIPASYDILPDNQEKIRTRLEELCAKGVDLIFTTGGTGLGPRDVTVAATAKVIEKEAPGIMEAARSYGQARTPYAMLSGGLAGLKGKSLIINLPGSSKGAAESLDAIFPGLLHAYSMIQGGGH